MTARGPAFRLLPRVDQDNQFFWTSGADGKLRFLRCRHCRYYVHPPAPRCPELPLRTRWSPRRSAAGPPWCAHTVNVHGWIPGSEPYMSGWWPSTNRPSVRLTTNLVDVGARRRPHRDGGRGDLRAERRRLPPPVPPGRGPRRRRDGEVEHRSEPLERRAVISGIGQSAVGRRLGSDRHRPHRRGVPGRRRRRRPDPGRHRRPGHLSGHGDGHRRFRRARAPRGPGRPPPPASTGTTAAARARVRCGPSSPPAWPWPPASPATCSSTGR